MDYKEIDFDKIHVPLLGGPIGSCGFRSGLWTCVYEGKEYKFFASICHELDIEEQVKSVKKEFSNYYLKLSQS